MNTFRGSIPCIRVQRKHLSYFSCFHPEAISWLVSFDLCLFSFYPVRLSVNVYQAQVSLLNIWLDRSFVRFPAGFGSLYPKYPMASENFVPRIYDGSFLNGVWVSFLSLCTRSCSRCRDCMIQRLGTVGWGSIPYISVTIYRDHNFFLKSSLRLPGGLFIC